MTIKEWEEWAEQFKSITPKNAYNIEDQKAINKLLKKCERNLKYESKTNRIN